jgi:hypothetical protein
MAEIDLERIISQTYYALDFIERLNSIEDFLALSEHTLDWQLRVEHQRIQNLDEDKFPIAEDFDPRLYRTELMENATERFTTTLPTFLRHTSLMAFTSAVEIAAIDLKNRTEANFSNIKDKQDSVTIMILFNTHLLLGAEKLLADFRNLVTVRNFIVHNRPDRKHNLDDAVSALGPHFRISNILLRGKHVFIERGGLEPHISRMKDFIPKLWEACDRKGLFSPHRNQPEFPYG